ncbi:MAG: DUF2116 family Zn-ribbon domain-containing protein [Nitrososphaerota archaeon]|nr:DUF2116 family Zn-ribbon domain-containing protein [Nitrososphaerota archaeon]MDG6924134.1 DUF2116 family Zn-ribbon domain-containing protein [Nitrososphaerota archaeon]
MVHENKALSQIQEQFLYGGLLGDSYLTKIRKNRINSALSIVHSSAQAEYTMYKYSLMQEFTAHSPTTVPNLGWGTELIRLMTLAYPCFTEARLICYPKGKKKVTRRWLDKITSPFALAIWFMDDGSLGRKFGEMRIATNGFSLEENLLLINWLSEKWGVKPFVREDTLARGFYLAFHSSERDKFVGLIREYIIPSMQYKIPKEILKAICPVCGKSFVPKRKLYGIARARKWKMYCSRTCNLRAARLRNYHPIYVFCAVCGTMFRKMENQATCSKSCSRTYQLSQKKIYRQRYLTSKSRTITTTSPTMC